MTKPKQHDYAKMLKQKSMLLAEMIIVLIYIKNCRPFSSKFNLGGNLNFQHFYHYPIFLKNK
jgi:hypothetical protein